MTAGAYERDLEEAVRVGAAMREAQRVYFRDRDPAILVRAKALEKQFDEMSARIIGGDLFK